MLKRWTALISFVSGFGDIASATTTGNDCAYDYLKVNNLASLVDKQIADTDKASPYDFLWEKAVYDGACLKISDPDELKSQRFKELWRRHGHKFMLDSLGGYQYINTVAAKKHANEYISFAIKYDLYLNFIDLEGQTVLDFLDKHLERALPSLVRVTYEIYREDLVKAGAKRAAELPNAHPSKTIPTSLDPCRKSDSCTELNGNYPVYPAQTSSKPPFTAKLKSL